MPGSLMTRPGVLLPAFTVLSFAACCESLRERTQPRAPTSLGSCPRRCQAAQNPARSLTRAARQARAAQRAPGGSNGLMVIPRIASSCAAVSRMAGRAPTVAWGVGFGLGLTATVASGPSSAFITPAATLSPGGRGPELDRPRRVGDRA